MGGVGAAALGALFGVRGAGGLRGFDAPVRGAAGLRGARAVVDFGAGRGGLGGNVAGAASAAAASVLGDASEDCVAS